MHPERWEHGSDYGSIAGQTLGPSVDADHPWAEAGQTYGCGRDALCALVEHGVETRSWRRLWLPSYFCEDVVAALDSLPIEILRFADGPWSPKPRIVREQLVTGDACLMVNFFGTRDRLGVETEGWPPGIDIVQDHTHDPWSPGAHCSRASYAVASLRKTLPLPDGGVLWSPLGLPLPPAPQLTEAHAARAAERREGMEMKTAYLAGGDVSKDAFRARLLNSEQSFGGGQPSAMSKESRALLDRLPIADFRRLRRENHRYLAERLTGSTTFEVFHPQSSTAQGCPLALVILCLSEAAREDLRRRCIEARIYPAILWASPAAHDVEADVAFSSRMLALHCDMRYEREDLDRVVGALLR
ncbi:MAG: hypothetical protein VB934_17745 [Polyangiaceae bacterium]